MTETVIKTYERIKKPENKKKIIDKSDLLIRIFGIFCAAASPYFGIAPFGLSFLSLERKLSLKSAISVLAIFLGSLLIGDKLMTVKYLAASFLYIICLFVLEKGVRLSFKVSVGIISGALVAVSVGIGYIRGYTIEWILTLIYEAAGIFLGAYAMEHGKKILREKRLFSRNLSGEEKFSLIVIGAVLFLSLKNFDFIPSFSLANFTAAFLILASSRSCGAAMSAALGIGLGMLCGIETDYFLPFMGAFGFCSFAAGIFAKKGKLWAVISLAVADAVVIVYVNGAMREMLSIYEIIAASGAFFAVPDKVYDRFGRLLKIKNNETELIKKIKGSVILRLKAVSVSFSSLGEALSRLSDKEEAINSSDIATVFDKAAEKVCCKCKRADICWNKEFNTTYKNFFRVMETVDKKGSAEEADLNAHFGSKCGSIPRLTAELNNQLNIYRINSAWKKRLGESREVVSEQIVGVSKIINELAREINEDINYDSLTASELKVRIESRGVRVKDINVIRNREGKLKIEMRIRETDYNTRGRGVIRAAAENITGNKVDIYKIREDGESVMIMIDESEQYEIEQGYASVGASEESGDNFRCIMPGGGKFVITLSDGMGTGKRAASESQAIVELLDSFMRAGFDKRVAVKLINSIMVLKSANETFATLDMCIIDLHTGEVEFIKTGAEPSFIKQNGKVETVRSASLPVGLMPEMEVETFARHLREGDTIVMVTDGVETKVGGNKWIKGFMEGVCETSANDLAARLLDKAIEENNGAVSDDMTVISLKLRKKSA